MGQVVIGFNITRNQPHESHLCGPHLHKTLPKVDFDEFGVDFKQCWESQAISQQVLSGHYVSQLPLKIVQSRIGQVGNWFQ